MTDNVSGRTLAYLGDAAWTLAIRKMLIEEGETRAFRLHKRTVAYVNAAAQASFYEALHEERFFTSCEEAWFRRGRNGHQGTLPGGVNAQTYRIATGFEAIIGGLQLAQNYQRIAEIRDKVRTLAEG